MASGYSLYSFCRYTTFGSPMSNRSFNATTSRYGFNGKENDNEIVGTGNGTQDYGMRIYNPALGRFLSVDPLISSYPWYTPYQFAGNKPVWAIDLDGLEEFIYTYLYKGKDQPAQCLSKEPNVRNNADGTRTNIKTGEIFNEAEIGKLQYQYVDASGKEAMVKRDKEGNYVENKSEGELISMHEDGMFKTIYTGQKNPLDDNGRKDYRREPVNNLDYAAYKHDKAYDDLRKDGVTDFVSDRASLAADKQLLKDYAKIITHKMGETGAKNTVKEKFQAGVQVVLMSFYITPKLVSQKDSNNKKPREK